MNQIKKITDTKYAINSSLEDKKSTVLKQKIMFN